MEVVSSIVFVFVCVGHLALSFFISLYKPFFGRLGIQTETLVSAPVFCFCITSLIRLAVVLLESDVQTSRKQVKEGTTLLGSGGSGVT